MAIDRTNPDTPCPASGAHHPHRWECDGGADGDCCNGDAWELNGVGEYVWLGELGLDCCVCGQTWPCETKRAHVAARAAR